MTRHTPAVAFAALFAATAFVQAQSPATFTDPANLRGERVRPRTGRELPIDSGVLGLQQLLRKLQTRASILNIVAHPDDEDGGMLTLYARGLGTRVADLSLTRGEGGQNAMTGDFEDALGLLRTQELLANDRYTGVDQMFGTEVDFGFSKTKSEAFKKWTHERVLSDAVRAIRLYRPLVITSTWIGNPTDGHGQHQVSGEIAQEAFVAAGDPKVFPELTREGIFPWQPLRMYARVPMQSISKKGLFDYATGQYVPAEFVNYVTGEKSTTPPSTDITVHEGTTDPLLVAAGASRDDLPNPGISATEQFSYVQFARIGLGLQKSQIGPGVRNVTAGVFDVPYHLYGDRTETAVSFKVDGTFFDGIDTTVDGMATLAPSLSADLRAEFNKLGEQIRGAAEVFAEHPDGGYIAPPLANALQTVTALITAIEGASLPETEKASLLHELLIKRVQLNDGLALALNLTLEATTREEEATVDSDVPVWLALRTGWPGDLTLTEQSLENAPGTRFKPLPLDEAISNLTAAHAIQRSVKVPAALTGNVTRPYFTRDSIETPVYRLTSDALRNAPASPPALTAWATINYRGVPVIVGRVLHHEAQAFNITPSTNFGFNSHAQVVPLDTRIFSFGFTARGLTTPYHGLKLQALGAKLEQTGRFNDWGFTYNGTLTAASPAPLTIIAAGPDATTPLEGYRAVGYEGLAITNAYKPATDRIVPVDLTLPPVGRRRVGYLPGTGDAVPEALASLGFDIKTLAISDFNTATLASFDTVILGVRAYAAQSKLHGDPTQALLEFARTGGNVVVQYQTSEFTADDAPYPLSLGSNEKVVDETAPVQLLKVTDALLTTPNRITPADFNGWNEERGHGFMGSWDEHYTVLTETHDPGEPSEHVLPQEPQRGGLLTTPLGKGRWTYVAYALYRQLPEAVQGAFRLFVNLLNP